MPLSRALSFYLDKGGHIHDPDIPKAIDWVDLLF